MSLANEFKKVFSKKYKLQKRLMESSEFDREEVIDGNMVSIGKYTYGVGNIELAFHPNCPQLSIGRYCSIAGNVRIFLGAYHRLDWITTYPFGLRHQDKFGSFTSNGFPSSNGPVVIGNDVWIGNSVTIMSGIKIGDGAVLAAGSHVIKDVKPYEVVGGNPARHIKFRFDPEIIAELLEIKWWNLPDEELKPYVRQLMGIPSIENLKKYPRVNVL